MEPERTKMGLAVVADDGDGIPLAMSDILSGFPVSLCIRYHSTSNIGECLRCPI